jgi:hypothetical protein
LPVEGPKLREIAEEIFSNGSAGEPTSDRELNQDGNE